MLLSHLRLRARKHDPERQCVRVVPCRMWSLVEHTAQTWKNEAAYVRSDSPARRGFPLTTSPRSHATCLCCRCSPQAVAAIFRPSEHGLKPWADESVVPAARCQQAPPPHRALGACRSGDTRLACLLEQHSLRPMVPKVRLRPMDNVECQGREGAVQEYAGSSTSVWLILPIGV